MLYKPQIFSLSIFLGQHDGGLISLRAPMHQSPIILQERKALPIPCPLSPWCRQPLIYFLPAYICLFWTFHINALIQNVVFVMGFCHSAYCFLGSSMQLACVSPLFHTPHLFTHSSIDGHLGVLSLFGYCEQGCLVVCNFSRGNAFLLPGYISRSRTAVSCG